MERGKYHSDTHERRVTCPSATSDSDVSFKHNDRWGRGDEREQKGKGTEKDLFGILTPRQTQ